MIQFPSYLLLAPYVVGFIFIGLSFFAFRKRNQFKTSLYAFVGAIFIAGVAPALMNHKITLTDDQITHRSDFLVTQTEYGFALQEIDSIAIHSDKSSWTLHKKSGESSELKLGTLWSIYQVEIIAELKKMGLKFIESKSHE